MAKNEINYSDLSRNELELLKNTYIDQKVKSMNITDLKDFAIENISLQIKSTIGDEEELEAWQEMRDFFQDEFENKIRDLQIQMKSTYDVQTNLDKEELKIKKEEKEEEDKKLDMWED